MNLSTAESSVSPDTVGTRRIIELDGLRGFAALGVIAGHVLETQLDWLRNSHPLLHDRLQFIRYSVDIFFVLSGFLVGGMFFDHKHRSNFLVAFYTRRAARILPLYYLLLAVAFLPILDPWSKMSEMKIPRWTYLVFIDNFWHSAFILPSKWLGILWTICIEEQFYVVAPLVVVWCSSKTVARLCVVCALGMLGLREFILSDASLVATINLWRFTFTAGDGLAIGLLGAWIVRQPFWNSVVSHHGHYLRLGTWLGFLTMISLITQPFPHSRGIGITIASLATLMVILCAHSSQNLALLKPLRWHVFLEIGNYSYFIYLFHQMILSLLLMIGPERLTGGIPSLTLAALFFMLIAATLLPAIQAKKWIEDPVMALAKRVSWDGRPETAPNRLKNDAAAVVDAH